MEEDGTQTETQHHHRQGEGGSFRRRIQMSHFIYARLYGYQIEIVSCLLQTNGTMEGTYVFNASLFTISS